MPCSLEPTRTCATLSAAAARRDLVAVGYNLLEFATNNDPGKRKLLFLAEKFVANEKDPCFSFSGDRGTFLNPAV